LNKLKKISYLALCIVFCLGVFVSASSAQDRPRVVRSVSSQPVNQPPAQPSGTNESQRSSSSVQRPILSNPINVVQPEAPAVKRTGDSSPLNQMTKAAARRTVYGTTVSEDIMGAIQSRLGIPYRFGATGPNAYDCSGFVWSVFHDAGLDFTRSSARTLWNMSTPVTGDERFQFGTLVFMNRLGHIGIVVDENGFYHASRSKGIIYSTFKGYWENRIDGFRRLDLGGGELAK
jgi:cell wall-associated NlpC family hydrolase